MNAYMNLKRDKSLVGVTRPEEHGTILERGTMDKHCTCLDDDVSSPTNKIRGLGTRVPTQVLTRPPRKR